MSLKNIFSELARKDLHAKDLEKYFSHLIAGGKVRFSSLGMYSIKLNFELASFL